MPSHQYNIRCLNMGAQIAKQRVKSSERKAKSVRTRLQKLRKNKTAPLFTTTSTVSLTKWDSLIDIHDYQMKSPSYINLNQTAHLDVHERPDDWLRSYRDIRNKVHACTGHKSEYRSLKRELEAFMQGLDECDVWELKTSLFEKLHCLELVLDEKRTNAKSDTLENKEKESAMLDNENNDEADQRNDLVDEVDEPSIASIRHMQMLDAFLGFSFRLDAVRYRMVLYYGDNKQAEYFAIQLELETILKEVQAIKDRGELQTIVTREEYEDYIHALQQRFQRLVDGNMRQSKTSILNGGTARSIRLQRRASVVSAE